MFAITVSFNCDESKSYNVSLCWLELLFVKILTKVIVFRVDYRLHFENIGFLIWKKCIWLGLAGNEKQLHSSFSVESPACGLFLLEMSLPFYQAICISCHHLQFFGCSIINNKIKFYLQIFSWKSLFGTLFFLFYGNEFQISIWPGRQSVFQTFFARETRFSEKSDFIFPVNIAKDGNI